MNDAQSRRSARFLICRPEHFAVSYAINPWMDPQSWVRDQRAHAAAAREWAALHRKLVELGATIELVTPVAGPARPGVHRQCGGGARPPGAAGALPPSRAPARGSRTSKRPSARSRRAAWSMAFASCRTIWCSKAPAIASGTQPASCSGWAMARAPMPPRGSAVADMFGQEVVALELADQRFYHMDTALAPLPGGEVMYLPEAFTTAGLGRDPRPCCARRSASRSVSRTAAGLAANAVCLGHTLVLSDCSEALRSELAERGYRVVATPLPSFLRSGGSAFCLTLRLDRRSVRARRRGSCCG